MPANDHTKSILSYKEILKSYEDEYRDTDPNKRSKVIDKIAKKISDEARDKGAKIDGENLKSQIANVYSNHRFNSKDNAGPPVRVGKLWNPRLVIDHTFHDKIEETVNQLGPLDPHERIKQWAIALSEVCKSLDDAEVARYGVIAEKWNKEGPPKDIQRKQAEEKTGKYVMSFLDHMKKHLGLHATIFVAYADPEDSIKISEFESEGFKETHGFSTQNAQVVKAFRDSWGSWAKNTLAGKESNADGDEDDEEAQSAAEDIAPEILYLQLDGKGRWELKALPKEQVHRVKLARALRVYLTERWKLGGGGSRIMWSEVIKCPEWYTDERFLLTDAKFFNPDRISEIDVKAYWRHWYDLQKSGQPFTFKRVGMYKPEDGSEEEEEDEQQPGMDMTPQRCKSDKEKIAFLHSLLPQHELQYHSVISAVASMEAGEDVAFDPPASCFSWKWNGFYSDKSLHTPNSAKLEALFDWLNQSPHLISPGKPISRVVFLRICLGLGFLLKDVNLIQFTEDGGHSEDTPGYIVQSAWGEKELEAINAYILKVKSDLSGSPAGARQKKRKASMGDPAPSQRKAKNAAAKSQLPEGHDEPSVSQNLPKSKRKKVANTQSDPESDKGEGTSNTPEIRKSSRAKKPSVKYQESDMAGSQKRKKDQGGAVKGTKAKKNNGK